LAGITGAVNGLGGTLQGLVNHWGPGGGSVRMPNSSEQTFSEYGGTQARFASLLKAWYGDVDINSSFAYLPKRDGSYDWQSLFQAIDDGTVKGLICWGINPAVSSPNSQAARQALRKLDWMVVIDLWETETAAVWQEAACDTEVFLLPAAASLEKEGSVCNSCRWNQWRYKGADPPGEARSDLWIITSLGTKLKELYADQTDKNADAITRLTWDYGDPPDVHRVAREMNGYDLTTGTLLSGPGSLKGDGTTSCGNWLWCGMYTEDGNRAQSRDVTDPSGIGLFPGWGWAWPVNRRIMYNRASVDMDGNPWDAEHPVISWDGASWDGDVPDGGAPPASISDQYPFIMKPQGRGHLFGPGRPDGPFPEHYEPWETPVSNPLSPQQNNPAITIWETGDGGSVADYPIVATTHRLTEHMNAGGMTGRVPWLVDLMPEMFVEMSRELADARDITAGDTVVLESARGAVVEAKAVVTARLKPLQMNGTTVHCVSVPWNWGHNRTSPGDSGNLLTSRIGDPNTGIPEFRAFLCNLRKA
ncbi:MAG: molybdopterin dinucleotide binding domain-containing protein, partial [Chloroflexota bacterium]